MGGYHEANSVGGAGGLEPGLTTEEEHRG